MKKILKYGFILFVLFLSYGMIRSYLEQSEKNELTKKGEESQSRKELVDDKYNSAIKSLNSEDFISANRDLSMIITLDSTYSKIDSLRGLIKDQYEDSKKLVEKEMKYVKSQTYEDRDEFQQVTWVKPKSERGRFRNTIYSYFGKKNSTLWSPRIKFIYYGEDWIFWKKVVFLIDGQTYNYIPSERPKRDNNTKVWETLDIQLTTDLANIISKMKDAKSVKYRLIGDDKVRDYTLSKTKVNSLLNMLKYHYFLENNPKLENFKLH